MDEANNALTMIQYYIFCCSKLDIHNLFILNQIVL